MNRKEQKKNFDLDSKILLLKIMDDHVLEVHEVARITGYSTSAVYSWRNDNERNVPACAWGKIYEVTKDQRIPKQLTGDTNVMVIDLPETGEITEASIKHLVDNTKKHATVVSTLAEIFADGKVDRHDEKPYQQLGKAIPEAVKSLYQTLFAIEAAIEKSKL